jgi:hypothetical protein
MPTSTKTPQYPLEGIIIDGPLATEAIDSSGEELSVKGCDVSSLPESGVLNYEHTGPDKDGSFLSVIGRCIKAKKIFKRDDCENARERMYWDKLEIPFIYGIFRLFAEHANAEAASAIMRDQARHEEPQILRFSIEGSTIKKEGNRLVRTLARDVALTKRPCNKTAISNILVDPRDEPKKDVLAGLAIEKFEVPGREIISGADWTYIPYPHPEEDLAEALKGLRKALEAGMPGGVAGTQVGGSALQVSDGHRNRAKAALRDYDKTKHGKFRPYIKAQLPEASDEFLDYFTELADKLDVPGKLKILQKDELADKTESDAAQIEKWTRTGQRRSIGPFLKDKSDQEISQIYRSLAVKDANDIYGNASREGARDLIVQTAPHLPDDIWNERINSGEIRDLAHLASISKLPPERVSQLVDRAISASNNSEVSITDRNVLLRQVAENHGSDFSHEDVRKVFSSGNNSARRALWNNEYVKIPVDIQNAVVERPEKYGLMSSFGEAFSRPLDEGVIRRVVQRSMEKGDHETLRTLVSYQKDLPDDVKHTLASSGNFLIKMKLAQKHNLPKEAVDALLASNPTDVNEWDRDLHGMVALRQKLSPDQMRFLADHSHPGGGWGLTEKDEPVPEDVRKKLLARFPQLFAHRSDIRANETTWLANLDHDTVLNLANNHKAPMSREALDTVWGYKDPGLKEAVVRRPDVPIEHLREAMNDPDLREDAGRALGWHDPDSVHKESVNVKMGVAKLRKLRDLIQSQGKDEAHPKELPAGDWKQGRLPNGNISADRLQQIIDTQPAQKYNVSHDKWTGAQRHNEKPSKVFQLNLSTDLVNKMKTAGVYDTFKKMHEASAQSEHPVGAAGIGWVRYTGDKKTGYFVDEVQSDLGQSFVKQAAARAKEEGSNPEVAANEAEKKYPEGHYQKIKEIVFGGKHPNEVLHEAFHEWLRKNKKAVGSDIHVWAPEAKATISLHNEGPIPGHMQTTYRDVPKKMGMEPKKYGELHTQNNEEHEGKDTYGDVVRKSKLDELTQKLLKAAEEPTTPFHMFNGQAVQPGKIEYTAGPHVGEQRHLLHVNKDQGHVVLDPQGNRKRVDPKGEGSKFKILSHPTVQTPSLVVNHQTHGLPSLAHSPAQQDLVNGVDLAQLSGQGAMKGQTQNSGSTAAWGTSAKGKVGFVKDSNGMNDFFGPNSALGNKANQFSTAQREAGFHHLASTVFGLGEHVPVTAAFQHPVTGAHHSIQEKIEGGEHFDKNSDAHLAHMQTMYHSGKLDQLALMDMIMGNGDRHPGNYMLTPGKSAGIQLIDNGLTLSRSSDKIPEVPHYLAKTGRHVHGEEGPWGQNSWMQQPLHPEAVKWAKGLDPKKLDAEMKNIGVPKVHREEAGRRLAMLQSNVMKPGVTKAQAYYAPFTKKASGPSPSTVERGGAFESYHYNTRDLGNLFAQGQTAAPEK